EPNDFRNGFNPNGEDYGSINWPHVEQGSAVGTWNDLPLEGLNAALNANKNILALVEFTSPPGRNVVSGNTGDGVVVSGASATGNTVAGNLIGTDYRGTGLIPDTVAWYRGDGTAAPTVGSVTGTITGNVTFAAGE